MTKLEEALKKWEERAMRPIAYGAGFPENGQNFQKERNQDETFVLHWFTNS